MILLFLYSILCLEIREIFGFCPITLTDALHKQVKVDRALLLLGLLLLHGGVLGGHQLVVEHRLLSC